MSTIAIPFGWLLKILYEFFGSYGWALILFALLVKLILMPLSMKSKRSTLQTTRLNPRLKELEKKYEGNKEKYNEEVARIYKEEKINPMSGCLWTLIPFPILLALYYAIREPITIMMGVARDIYEGPIKDMLATLGYTAVEGMSDFYAQIGETQFISAHFSDFSGFSDKLMQINFNFLGLDLGMQPSFKVWEFGETGLGMWLQIGLFLLPVLSAGLSLLSSRVTQKQGGNTAPADGDSTASTMKMMVWMGPIISLWIGYSTPGALSLYWASSTLFQMLQETFLYRKYKKEFDAIDAERVDAERIREEELEQKRLETERLRAENATKVNPNTSKRKRDTAERQREDERRRLEEIERKKKAGIESMEKEQPDSQVGTRKYARGRAYTPERYDNPEYESPEYDAPGYTAQDEGGPEETPMLDAPEPPAEGIDALIGAYAQSESTGDEPEEDEPAGDGEYGDFADSPDGEGGEPRAEDA